MEMRRCSKKVCVGGGIALLVSILAIILALVLNVSNNDENNNDNMVQTSAGVFQGFKEKHNDKVSFRFKGIPFAEPPTGHLRWKPPVPKKKLAGTYVANISNTLCIQFVPPPFPPIMREPSEDCLYLHIHTPTLIKDANLPVLVWIHGGYLMNAYSDMPGYYPDGEFASAMNVVSVSLSYRLNAFGWLSLEELWQKDVSYGNYGLLDQILGLKWVQENIKSFGGDPDLVTVAGQSSGGTSVTALAASPLANGLFKRGIPMSGSPYFPRNYTIAAKDNRIFVEKSKCKNFTTEEEIRKCFYSLTPKEITDSIPGTVYPNWEMLDLFDFPTKDLFVGSVLVLDPLTLPTSPKDVHLVDKLNTKVDLLIGTTAQEVRLQPVRFFNQSRNLTTFLEEKFKAFQNMSVKSIYDTYENVTPYVKTKITPQYLFETIVTDARVGCATNRLVKDLRRNPYRRNAYRYVSAWKADKVIDAFVTFHDAAHLTDAVALFGFKWWNKDLQTMSQSENNFMNTIRKVFKKFMVEGLVEGSKPGETIVFNGDGNVVNIEGDYHKKQCKMWNDPSNGFLPYVWLN